jgi:hypothetical protein
MIVTTGNICHYLLDKGFVSRESVVDGDFEVSDVSGRNRNFKVRRRRRPSYFVKQIQHWDPQTIAMLQCEAACYWLAHNEAGFAPLAPLMPEFFAYDLERHVLVTELIPESENLYEYFRRVGGFPAGVAQGLGEALGASHGAAVDAPEGTLHGSIFPRQVPWILAADRRNSHPFKELSPATSQLFEVVEGSAELRRALEELRAGWRASSLMHGDMRWENCLITVGGDRPSFKIVDWELADIGDACWDVGAVLQAYLSVWVMSAPAAGHEASSAPAQEASASYPLEALQPSLRAFWAGYTSALQVGAAAEPALLERCVRYAAARMIQSAYEYVQFSPRVSAGALRMVQVSSDILRDTSTAGRELLGLRCA